MTTVKVLRRFYDTKEKTVRELGDVFEADNKRATQIENTLPGYVKVTPIKAKPKPKQKPKNETTETKEG